MLYNVGDGDIRASNFMIINTAMLVAILVTMTLLARQYQWDDFASCRRVDLAHSIRSICDTSRRMRRSICQAWCLNRLLPISLMISGASSTLVSSVNALKTNWLLSNSTPFRTIYGLKPTSNNINVALIIPSYSWSICISQFLLWKL